MKSLNDLVSAALELEPGLWIDYRLSSDGKIEWSCEASNTEATLRYPSIDAAVRAFLGARLEASRIELTELRDAIDAAELASKEAP